MSDPVLKRCNMCRMDLPQTAFSQRAASRDGLQSRCKQCWRSSYRENKAAHIETVRQRAALRTAEHRRRLEEYLRQHPCVDCAETDVRVLDFDHRLRSEKRGAISWLVFRVSWKRLEREVALCDVRCSNCHRRRTAQQLGWWNALPDA